MLLHFSVYFRWFEQTNIITLKMHHTVNKRCNSEFGFKPVLIFYLKRNKIIEDEYSNGIFKDQQNLLRSHYHFKGRKSILLLVFFKERCSFGLRHTFSHTILRWAQVYFSGPLENTLTLGQSL